jgi:hypothetical protein
MMGDYTSVILDNLDETQEKLINSIIHEGEMRQGEKIVALLERKITEAYAGNNKELIDFLENLIVEIEGM